MYTITDAGRRELAYERRALAVLAREVLLVDDPSGTENTEGTR